MTAAAKKNLARVEPVAWENPLIPNKKLRALYVAMVELRLLEEHVARQKGRRNDVSSGHRGLEGCRVSTTLDLKRGDLTTDSTVGLATSFLRSGRLTETLAHSLTTVKAHAKNENSGQLPATSEVLSRLYLAMGAALTLKYSRRRELLIAYVDCDELGLADWKLVLRFAAEQVLPVIFVVLPRETKSVKQAGQLSLASSKCGVPGIPVDAADPVALYRVAQESMLRARAGGGPALMECISFQLAGKKSVPADPILTMREFLLPRGIVDEAWLDGVETRFTARLAWTR